MTSALFVLRNGARDLESFILELLKNEAGTGLIIFMLWLGQRAITQRLDKMSRRMDCFETSQHACQLDNAKYFATKDELHEVETDVAEHERRISRLEGSK